MEPFTKTVLAIDERLLRVVGADDSPLDAIYASLAELAAALAVRRVVVAIDDPRCGRQVFCSSRQAVGAWPVGLTGPPRLYTDPPLRIPRAAQTVLIESVQAAFARSRTAHGRERGLSPMQAGLPRFDQLAVPVSAAAARAVRYGWGFTLVCVSFTRSDDRFASRESPSLLDLRAALRAGDTVIELGPGGLGLLLEATRDEEIPPILARVARHAELPPFSFGLAHCPGDGSDAKVLIDEALNRLVDARLATAAEARTIRAAAGHER